MPSGGFRSQSLWPASIYAERYLSTFGSYGKTAIGGDDNYAFTMATAVPLGGALTVGATGSVASDRFFANHHWGLWVGRRFSNRLSLAFSGDVVGYSFDSGDAKIEGSDDPLASAQNEFRASASAGFALRIGRDISIAAVARNLLRPDISVGSDVEDCSPMRISSGFAWRFGNAIPFVDFDVELSDEPIYDIRAGFAFSSMKDRAHFLFGGGSSALFGSAGYDFGEIVLGYGIEKPLGDAANVRGLEHRLFLEFNPMKSAADTISMPCSANTLPAKWLRISKPAGLASFEISISAGEYDSVLFHGSSSQSYKMSRDEKGIWRIELSEFPEPSAWISAFAGDEMFCLQSIYKNGPAAARMTVIMDEYELLVPFSSAADSAVVAEIRAKGVPFYLDSENERDWGVYLDAPDADRFLFAAPSFEPRPPRIELASEFAVEKVDNRVHAVVVVSSIGMPHRIIVTSEWAGDCAVNSSNPMDTMTFIVPDHVPKTIPIVVTGSATDSWFRVHRIGPDTLDNAAISKVWEATDYSLFNFIYDAEDDRNCRGDIDPKLERLVARAKDSGGKLMITGRYYSDAHCAYDHARKTLPASQVRIDPSLVPEDMPFTDLWQTPDSLWFVNNFSQAIVEWKTIPQPDEVAGYVVFADDAPIPFAANYIELKKLQINAEPVNGNMFILSGLIPEKAYHIRIAPLSGDGRLGELSRELIVKTKARRKTGIYEFMSKLGNPSAFDFSEYTESSMLSKNAPLIDLYLGTNAMGDGYGSLMLKSPSRVHSERRIWQTRNAGILFIDFQPLGAPFDVQEFTTMEKKQEEPCRIGARYLVRTPDGYELIIRVESVEGKFPNRRIEIQYLYRLVEGSPVFDFHDDE